MTSPGPLGDEARALVDAARDWAARTFPDLDTHLATGSAECQWCPVCRAVAALRTPETADRIATAVTAAAGALAAVLEALTAPGPGRDPAPPPGTDPAPPSDSDPAARSGTDPAPPSGVGRAPRFAGDPVAGSYDIPVDEL